MDFSSPDVIRAIYQSNDYNNSNLNNYKEKINK
jgi:hypothetical protein